MSTDSGPRRIIHLNKRPSSHSASTDSPTQRIIQLNKGPSSHSSSTDSQPRRTIQLKRDRDSSQSYDSSARSSKSQRTSETQRTSVGEDWALSEYDCNLDFQVADDGVSASTMSDGGFAYLWSGGRSNMGVSGGKYAFECEVTENIKVAMGDTRGRNQNIMRVGWSLTSSDVGCLGETDTSFGFGGTGVKSTAKKI